MNSDIYTEEDKIGSPVNIANLKYINSEGIDDLVEKAGGWGILQTLCLLFSMLALQGIDFYSFNLAYFELLPVLSCTTDGIEYHQCGQANGSAPNIKDIGYVHQSEMCVDGKLIGEIDWQVDYTDKRSLNNWMTEFELYCKPRFYIGLFGSMYFIGYALSGLVVKIFDFYGRVFMINVCTGIQTVLVLLVYFIRDYRYFYPISLIIGISAASKLSIYIYANEISTKKHKVLVNCCLNASGNCIPVIISSCYFILGGKNWRPLIVIAFIALFITFTLSFFMPESPKYLHAKGEYKKFTAYIERSARLKGIRFKIEDGLRIMDSNPQGKSDNVELAVNTQGAPYSIWRDLQNPTTLINFIMTVSMFSFAAFNYFVSQLYMKYVGGDIFYNMLFSGISEFLAILSIYFIIRCLGAKLGCVISVCITILFSLPLLFDLSDWMIGVCIVSLRFGIQATYPIMNYFCNLSTFNPLFMSFEYLNCNIFGMILVMVGTQIAELPKPIPILSILIISILILVGVKLLRM